MGLFSKLKEKSRGIMTAAEPAEGVPPAPVDDVRSRLLAISGPGIEADEDEGAIVVSWAAKVDTIGPGGADASHVYRAIRVELDPSENEAGGIGYKTDTDAELLQRRQGLGARPAHRVGELHGRPVAGDRLVERRRPGRQVQVQLVGPARPGHRRRHRRRLDVQAAQVLAPAARGRPTGAIGGSAATPLAPSGNPAGWGSVGSFARRVPDPDSRRARLPDWRAAAGGRREAAELPEASCLGGA